MSMHANGDDKLKAQAEIPSSPREFHLEMPLYKEITVTGDNLLRIHNLLTFDETIDAYCIFCGKDSVFECNDRPVWSAQMFRTYLKDGKTIHTSTSYKCTRNFQHKYTSYFRVGNKTVTKVGQDPSVADLQIPQIQEYRKILSNEEYAEFTRAVGLAAHGVGIGSFVYLRRIFEGLIEKAHAKASQGPGFDDSKYSDSKIEKKILLLKDFLPPFLVENRAMYKILSTGIHGLTEQECLTYFDFLKDGIELILDDQMRERARIEKEKKARTSISKIAGKLKKQ